MTLHQSLSNVLALADKATAIREEARRLRSEYMQGLHGDSMPEWMIAKMSDASNAQAELQSAAASLIHADGPALLALAQMGERPVAWEVRTRPIWRNNDAWSEWRSCSKESHGDYLRVPVLHDCEYQTRALCALPPAVSKGEGGGSV